MPCLRHDGRRSSLVLKSRGCGNDFIAVDSTANENHIRSSRSELIMTFET